MDKFGSTENLSDDDTKTRAPGLAAIIKSLVGRAAVLRELSTGSVVNADGTPIFRRNPCGRVGVDLSGPPWGAAKRHPLLVLGGRTHPDGGQDVAAFTSVRDVTLDLECYVRPFAPGPSVPYSRGYFAFSWQQSSGVSQVVTVTVGRGTAEVDSVNVALGPITTVQAGTHSAIYVPLTPKGNEFWVRLSTSSTSVIRLVGLTLSQTVKLGH